MASPIDSLVSCEEIEESIGGNFPVGRILDYLRYGSSRYLVGFSSGREPSTGAIRKTLQLPSAVRFHSMVTSTQEPEIFRRGGTSILPWFGVINIRNIPRLSATGEPAPAITSHDKIDKGLRGLICSSTIIEQTAGDWICNEALPFGVTGQ